MSGREDDQRFGRLRRAWAPVRAWYADADPRCPCKGIVAPSLRDWNAFEADWLAGAPDRHGLDDHTASLRDAIATIQNFAGRKLVDEIPDPEIQSEGASCAVDDPTCRGIRDPLDPETAREAAFLAARAGHPGTMLRLMADDPRLGAPSPGEGLLSGLGGLFGQAAGAAQGAAQGAVQEAGQGAARGAVAEVLAAVPKVGEAVRAEVAPTVAAATDAARPAAADVGAEAGRAAGKAAAEAAQEGAAGAWGTGAVVAGAVVVLGAVAIWAATRKGKL